METLKPIIVVIFEYIAIAFGQLNTTFKYYKCFQVSGDTNFMAFFQREPHSRYDKISKLTPTMYFKLSERFKTRNKIYNLRKFKYELNNNVTNQ